jgi:endonuclease/exonuclease/phosphatase family metal-dependent hydrolase
MRRLRIATFNLENLDDAPDAEVPFAERAAVLRPQLARVDADILCLQEIHGQAVSKHHRALHALEKLLEGTPYAGYAAAASEHPPGHGPASIHNLATLSRFPILKSECIKQSLVSPPLYRPITSDPPAAAPEPVAWERPVLYSVIELPGGRPLHIINLHLKAPLAAHVPGQKMGPFQWRSVAGWAEGFFLADVKRVGQALEVRLLIDRIFDADEDAFIVVAGDLNADISEMPARLLLGHIEDTGNGLLAHRAMVAIERGLPEERRFSVVHAGARVMLDHLLVSRALLAHYRRIEVHNEALGDELIAYASVRASPESYHAPVVAELELPDEPSAV